MSIDRKHILIVTPAFPESESKSHSVVYFSNYIKAYSHENPQHKISIISLQLPAERKNYKYFDIDVFALGTYGQAKWKKIKTWQKIMKLAQEINEKNKISIVHALWLKECAFVAERIAKKLKLHSICTVMGMELKRKNQFLRLLDLKKMHLVFVSPRHYSIHRDQVIKTKLIDIIPWGIDHNSVHLDTNHKKTFDILFVGFLNENKNLNLFVEIIKKLKSQRQNIKAIVIGDFFNLDEWKNKIKILNLENQIEFKGLLPNPEVLKIMKNGKILLHTSNYESLGYVMLEALSQGMHVVSKEVGIAENSDHWHICNKQGDFTSTISNILNNYKPLKGTAPVPLHETVGSYTSLYRKYSI